jgi:quinol monooxygenase YgiN
MYGTVAKFKAKPGAFDALMKISENQAAINIKGYVGQYIYRMDDDPNVYYLTALFKDKQSYVANANSPEQNERFQEMAKYFVAEPEWHDGEIVFSHTA